MKKLLLFAFAAFALALPAAAQFGLRSYQPVVLANIPSIADGVVSNATATAVVTDQQNVAIATSFKLVGAGTGAILLTFVKSVDGTLDGTLAGEKLTYAIAANGTTVVTGFTNFNLGGVGYLKLASVSNSCGSTITNLTVTYAIKAGSP